MSSVEMYVRNKNKKNYVRRYIFSLYKINCMNKINIL